MFDFSFSKVSKIALKFLIILSSENDFFPILTPILPSLSFRISAWPDLASLIADFKSAVTDPNFGLGIKPFGPKTLPSLDNFIIIAGVQINFSTALGQYNGSYKPSSNVSVGEYDPNDGNYSSTSFRPNIIGIGYDFTLSNVLFLEGHPSMVGKGFGYRGFMGLSFENFIYKLPIKLKKKNQDLFSGDIALPFNILVGLEGFITSDIGFGNPSYWGGVGVRIDYNFKSAP